MTSEAHTLEASLSAAPTRLSSAGKRCARLVPAGTLVAMILALAISPVVHGATAAASGTEVWDSLYTGGSASSIATSRDGTRFS